MDEQGPGLTCPWPTQVPKENSVSREDISSLVFLVNLYAAIRTQPKCHLLPNKLLGKLQSPV